MIKKNKYPMISIVVTNLNGMNLNILEDCMNSMLKCDYPNWELIVVDSDSTDGSVQYLTSLFKDKINCRMIKNPVRMYSQGLNLGARCAKGEFIAFFNNDVAITKNYFNILIEEFMKDDKLVIAQGKLLNYFNHKVVDSAGETMDLYGNPITIGSKEPDNKQFDHIEEILSASGSANIVRKSFFESVGGYDPDFCIGYEDMDLSLRARRAGYVVKRFPSAIIYHKRASTDLADFIKVQNKWHFNKNRLSTMIKNYPLPLLVKTLPVTLLLYFGISLWETIVNRNLKYAWVRISSIIWTMANMGKIITKRQVISNKYGSGIGKKELLLFSPKKLIDLFLDFKNTK